MHTNVLTLVAWSMNELILFCRFVWMNLDNSRVMCDWLYVDPAWWLNELTLLLSDSARFLRVKFAAACGDNSYPGKVSNTLTLYITNNTVCISNEVISQVLFECVFLSTTDVNFFIDGALSIFLIFTVSVLDWSKHLNQQTLVKM